jgi:hypothetical protein
MPLLRMLSHTHGLSAKSTHRDPGSTPDRHRIEHTTQPQPADYPNTTDTPDTPWATRAPMSRCPNQCHIRARAPTHIMDRLRGHLPTTSRTRAPGPKLLTARTNRWEIPRMSTRTSGIHDRCSRRPLCPRFRAGSTRRSGRGCPVPPREPSRRPQGPLGVHRVCRYGAGNVDNSAVA